MVNRADIEHEINEQGLSALLGMSVGRLVTVTGAGLSIATGLPSGPDLVRGALRILSLCADTDLQPPSRIEQRLPLEVFFQIIADHAESTAVAKLTRSLDGGKPTAGHKWISAATQQGHIYAGYTFNFDTLQERCLPRPSDSRAIGRSWVVNYDQFEFSLTKLHGSADSLGVISISEYVQGFADPVRRKLLSDIKGRTILFLGYGGWDVDLHIALDEAIRLRMLPDTVIWIDRSFPINGGRTEILKNLSDAGVTCVPVTGDLQELSAHEVESPLSQSEDAVPLNLTFSHFRTLQPTIARAILIEAALVAGEMDWVRDILGDSESIGSQTQTIRAGAMLSDRLRNKRQAAKLYSQLVETANAGATSALAAAKAFSLSSGKLDCFDSVQIENLCPVLQDVFATYVRTRRTDIGGLERQELAEVVRLLPNPFEIAQGVDSLDAVRLYISILSETARILHESGDWNSALHLDRRAYRFAMAVGEPDALAMTAGNIGACYMGIVDDSNGIEKHSHLLQAKEWLSKATSAGPETIGAFAWGLHMCNLGTVLGQLDRPTEGIDLILSALPILRDVFPNYAVCFYGHLALAYCKKFDKIGDPQYLREANLTVSQGWALAEELNDFDDVHFLEDAEQAIEIRVGGQTAG